MKTYRDFKCYFGTVSFGNIPREANVPVLEATPREAYSSLYPYVNHREV